MVEDRLQDWQAIIDKAIAQAKAGDGKARDWLGRYVLGNRQLRVMAGLPEPRGKTVNELLEDLKREG